jgi:hypothetical protein
MRISTNSSKRLVWNWPTPNLEFTVVTWLTFSLLNFIIVGPLTHKGHWWWLDTVNACLLGGPFVIAGLVLSVRELWRDPPFRIEE